LVGDIASTYRQLHELERASCVAEVTKRWSAYRIQSRCPTKPSRSRIWCFWTRG